MVIDCLGRSVRRLGGAGRRIRRPIAEDQSGPSHTIETVASDARLDAIEAALGEGVRVFGEAASDLRRIAEEGLPRNAPRNLVLHLKMVADRLELTAMGLSKELDSTSRNSKFAKLLGKGATAAVPGLGALTGAVVTGAAEGATGAVTEHRLSRIEAEVLDAAAAIDQAPTYYFALKADQVDD